MEKIKKEMIEYRDLLGQPLIGSERVKDAETKEELAEIIDEHEEHLEGVVNDTQSALRSFKTKIGLGFQP